MRTKGNQPLELTDNAQNAQYQCHKSVRFNQKWIQTRYSEGRQVEEQKASFNATKAAVQNAQSKTDEQKLKQKTKTKKRTSKISKIM